MIIFKVSFFMLTDLIYCDNTFKIFLKNDECLFYMLKLLNNLTDYTSDDVDLFYQSKMIDYEISKSDIERFLNGEIIQSDHNIIHLLDYMQYDKLYLHIDRYIKKFGINDLNIMIVK